MLLGGFSMLGASTKFTEVPTLKTAEATSLGEADEVIWSAGTKQRELTQDGWFDDAVGSLHNAMYDLAAVQLPMSIAPHGNTNGAAFDGWSSIGRLEYKVQLTSADLTKAAAKYQSAGVQRQGIIVHALGTEVAAGNTDTLDVMLTAGANPAGTNGGAIFTHVTAVGGTAAPTSVTFSLRHSTDGVTYADKAASYTTIAAANIPASSSDYQTFTGTINKYASVAWTYTGGTAPTVTFFVGVYVAP